MGSGASQSTKDMKRKFNLSIKLRAIGIYSEYMLFVSLFSYYMLSLFIHLFIYIYI